MAYIGGMDRAGIVASMSQSFAAGGGGNAPGVLSLPTAREVTGGGGGAFKPPKLLLIGGGVALIGLVLWFALRGKKE